MKGICVSCICYTCNKIFELPKFRINEGRGLYCSRKCSNQRKNKPQKAKPKTLRLCKKCGKEYSAKNRYFCSRKCAGHAGGTKRNKVEVICKICNTSFIALPCNIKRGKAKFCSPGCFIKSIKGKPRKYIQTEETRNKIRMALKGRKRPPEVGKKVSISLTGRPMLPKTREALIRANTGRKWSEQSRIKLSKSRKGKYVGKNNHRYGKPPPHGKWFSHTSWLGKTYRLRSSYEKKYAEYLDIQKSIWDYEATTYDLGDFTWTPDFTIFHNDKSKEIHEVKGFMRDESNLKIKYFREKYPNIPLTVLMKEDLKRIGIQV